MSAGQVNKGRWLRLSPLIALSLCASRAWAQQRSGSETVEVRESTAHESASEAEESDGPNSEKAAPDVVGPKETSSAFDPDVLVRADPTTRRFGSATLSDGGHASMGDRLDEEPGVAAARRGSAGTEPFLRGWGGERVMTQVGPVPLVGACPGVMDPPISYVRPTGTRQLRLSLTLPSVTDGPWGTGGRLMARSDPGPAPERLTTTLAGSFDSARTGGGGRAELSGGTPTLHLRGGVEAMQYGSYSSPSGIEVPAEQTEFGTSFSSGFSGQGGQSGWVAVSYARHQDISYPALPMDLRKTDGLLADATYRYDLHGGIAKKLELSAGLQLLDHVMDNVQRPNRGMLEARTTSRVRTGGLRLQLTSPFGPKHSLDWGVDGMTIFRDAWRNRRMVASGLEFDDHLWPGAVQANFGAFSEWHAHLDKRLSSRLGARLDASHMNARASDDASLGGTARQTYMRYYGSEAGDTHRTIVAGAANALLHWAGRDGWSAHGGVGLSTRPGSVTERYFAFAPAPAGFQVGNPNLELEKRGATEVGLRFSRSWLRVEALGHATVADDYILQTTIDTRDVNGDGVEDRILGFRNVGAQITGSEITVVPRFLHHFSVPTSFEVLWGQNTTDARPLPQIAPWEFRSALRLDAGPGAPGVSHATQPATRHDQPPTNGLRWRLWAELQVRTVGRQMRIDASFVENETEGFTVFRIEVGTRLARSLRASVAVENLTNEGYSEHLTRPALQAVGGLSPGQDIPAPGRRLLFQARSVF